MLRCCARRAPAICRAPHAWRTRTLRTRTCYRTACAQRSSLPRLSAPRFTARLLYALYLPSHLSPLSLRPVVLRTRCALFCALRHAHARLSTLTRLPHNLFAAGHAPRGRGARTRTTLHLRCAAFFASGLAGSWWCRVRGGDDCCAKKKNCYLTLMVLPVTALPVA